MLSTLSRVVCAATCLVALFLSPVQAQDDAALEKAIETFNAAEYDQAIEGFAALVEDASTEKSVKKQALQYLGRAYVAKRAYDDVRTTIDRLLDLEPPLYEPDADVEPPDLMELYYEVRRDYTGYEVERPDPGMTTLAVMDFTNTSVDEKERFDPMQQGFASMMINYLEGATDLKVIERERIQWLLDELELQRNEGLVDQSTAVRTGELLGATAVLFGAFTVHGKQMWLSARLVKVETGEILLAEQIFGKKDDFFELVEDLSNQVTDAIGVELASAGGAGGGESRSLDAVLSYSQGLGLIEQEKYQEAYDKFLEALEYDPSYTRARVKAESLKPQLG
jgi:TolB-like protein